MKDIDIFRFKKMLIDEDQEKFMKFIEECKEKDKTLNEKRIEAGLPQAVKEMVCDVVNHPSHYETGKFECIEVMEEALGKDTVIDFCLANAFKYLYRSKRKNGLEDIKKAQWYINRYIMLMEKEEEE